MRLMQFMIQHGECTVDDLERHYTTNVSTGIERLYAAKMVRRAKNTWKPLPLSQCFAVREIIAFEAKVRDWRGES